MLSGMLGDLAAGPWQACLCLRTSERILDCFGNLDNGEVPLFPSLHIRPGVEGHASLFCLVLLNMIFHVFPSSAYNWCGDPDGRAPCRRRRWHAGVGSDGCVDERHCTRRLLPPFHFGEPTGNMGMLRLDLACLVK